MLAGSLLLSLLAVTIYQPAVSCFWIVVFLAVLRPGFLTNREERVRIYWLFAAGILQLAIYFFFLNAYFAITEIMPSERIELLNQPGDKIYHFVRIQLPLAFGQWHLPDTGNKLETLLIGLIFCVVIFAGSWMFLAKHRLGSLVSLDAENKRHRHSKQEHLEQNEEPTGAKITVKISWIVCVISAGLMSHLHWLAVNSNPQNYRILGPLSICCSVMIFWSMVNISERIERVDVRKYFRNGVCVCLLVLAMYKTSSNLGRYWIVPRTLAHEFVVNEVRMKVTSDTKRDTCDPTVCDRCHQY